MFLFILCLQFVWLKYNLNSIIEQVSISIKFQLNYMYVHLPH